MAARKQAGMIYACLAILVLFVLSYNGVDAQGGKFYYLAGFISVQPLLAEPNNFNPTHTE